MNWSHPAFEALAAQLGARTGLDFVPGRRIGDELGIRRAMARAGIDDPERYHVMVASRESLLDDLLDELTVNETYFFREPAQFEFLRREVLPTLGESSETVRAWSAGCASGEEAYSLAMVLTDAGLGARARVLATDISREVLGRAGRASYGAWSLRGDGTNAALPHLVREGDCYKVRESIRRMVTLESLNLALDVYPSFATGTMGLDLIFCRNVLIYFNRETVRAVANRLAASLSERGWLFTASTDPPLGREDGLEPVVTDQGIFYRRAGSPSPVTLAYGDGPAEVSRENAERWDRDPLLNALAEARVDLAQGRYLQAAAKAGQRVDDPAACALNVRALANLDPDAASRACVGALARHPVSAELHYLHAVLLAVLGHDDEAASEARRVLYLDRTLAVAHFLLGSVSLRRGDRETARRCYRNARDLCAARRPEEILALSDGEPAGRLAELARLELERLGAAGGTDSP